MRIVLKTNVNEDYRSVMQQFDKTLFEKLSPPFPPVKLLRFDGSKRGDMVSMQLNFFLFKQRWSSLIVKDGTNEEEAYFIDEGTELPFFLSYWRHRHRVLNAGDHAIIVDDIHFKAPFRWLGYLLYPVMWAQFAYRKPVYRKIFGKHE